MKIRTCIASALLVSTVGCSSMNNTEKGLLGGTAVGAGAGALLGRGHPGAMLAGGVLGAAVGGIAGSDQDRREDRKAAIAAANAPSHRQMSLNEVVQMAQRGQSDSVIIGHINATNSIFQLTTDDLNELHQQRVSDNVINYMQSRRGRTVIMQQRPDVIYVAPPVYGPGVSIGVGGRF
ncbi:MAG: hypothetical protein EXR98_11100 [Gemmataceae bacterium]|nr:hypothetical protein [Gemmataceae bacterium]